VHAQYQPHQIGRRAGSDPRRADRGGHQVPAARPGRLRQRRRLPAHPEQRAHDRSGQHQLQHPDGRGALARSGTGRQGQPDAQPGPAGVLHPDGQRQHAQHHRAGQAPHLRLAPQRQRSGQLHLPQRRAGRPEPGRRRALRRQQLCQRR
ncbi:hypothetical protein OY671_012590, partial [Metschnikowia pulcherrima]